MTETRGLGRIEQVDLRKVWQNEAIDFTPWLADHISELGEALGLELELQEQEAPVGPFSLDMLAREPVRNRAVIIENQLEPTDHDHLGKLLTYEGGYDANVIVWVAKYFNDRHRQALDWLNQRTDEDTEFFGVTVEIWKIDDSRPAPHFNVVAAPNEWSKETKQNARAANTSESYRRYQVFFQKLADALTEQKFTNPRKALPQSWLLFPAGHGGRVKYGACFGHEYTARVEVYIDHPKQVWNKNMFDRLMEQQEAIESELSVSLDWQRLDNGRASRIALLRQGSIDDDQEKLNEIEHWMIEKLLDFKRVFGPKLDRLTI